MNKWLWSLLCVTLLGAAACSDDDTEGDSGNPIPPALSTENLPDAGLKFLYSALTPHTFTMNVDAPWEITKTAGWFVVTPNKGEAGQNIQVTVTPALNQGEARDGEFTIRANSGNNLHPCLTEKSIPLSQDAYLAAGIVITGLEERLLAFEAEDTDPVVFTVEASYDWTLTVENETWLTVAPKSGKAGSAAQVTITPKANTTDERRESKITITAGDAEFGENTAEEIIELVQAPYMPKDTHAEGHVFFSDDFQWIPDNWVSPYTKYGWPSVSIDGTNGNEFALSTDGMKEAVAAKGYTYTPSVYARYEGHVKLGKTANMGAITIPALTGIDAGKAATLLVQFDAAAYSSAGGTVDNGDDHMDVTIEGPGTIGDLVETSALVEVKCRLYLDNITVTRAKDENPEAPAPEALVTPLDKEIVNTSDPGLFDANSMVVAEGGTLTCSVRVNKAWTAETDCDWLTITTVRCGDADPSTVTGANNGASLSNGVATVKATGLPYVTTKVEVGRNSGGESRTGHIIIKSEGAEIEKVAVTQAAEGTSVTGIVITGLTENQIPEFAADATAETTFTVRADTDWTIEVPVAETWYSVTPLSGAANTDVTVTVTPTPNTGGARDGSFTIQSGTNTETILLSQAPSASALHFEWSFPATAEENNLVSRTERWYKSDDGKARIDAVRAVDNPSNPDMSYSLGYDNEIGRILMYGFALDDYWLFTLPVKNFKANTTLNLRALISSSASDPKFYILEYSADGQASWTSVNTTSIEDKSAKDTALRTIVYTHMMPDTPANGDVIVDDDITIPTAVADGNIYLRLRVCDAMAGNKAKNIVPANGGTTRMKTKEGICDAISVTEVQR